MGLIDSIIGVESGGNPNATNPNSSASASYMFKEFWANPHVGKLLLARCPAAIFGSVVAIAIDAVKGVVCAWPRPHVSKKVFEAVPALANLNALRPIVLIGNVLGVSTSAAHAAPDLIFGRGFPAAPDRNRHAVSSRAPAAASATSGVSGSKVCNRDNLFCSAVADTKYLARRRASALSDLGRGFCLSGQFSKLRTNAIYGGCH